MEMAKEIPLQNGMVAIVDDEDYKRCAEFNWTVFAKSKGSTLEVRNASTGIKLSHFIVDDLKSDSLVRFVDGDQLNFRKGNLTIATRAELAQNAKGHKGTTSIYKGVSWDKSRKKWVANICVNGKIKKLGRFTNEGDAAMAYNAAALKAWGEDCFLNVLNEDNNAKTHTLEKVASYRSKKNTTSEYQGVYKNSEHSSYVASITQDGETYYIGSYPFEIDAAKAYDAKAKELHGDKAILNFPVEVGIS